MSFPAPLPIPIAWADGVEGCIPRAIMLSRPRLLELRRYLSSTTPDAMVKLHTFDPAPFDGYTAWCNSGMCRAGSRDEPAAYGYALILPTSLVERIRASPEFKHLWIAPDHASALSEWEGYAEDASIDVRGTTKGETDPQKIADLLTENMPPGPSLLSWVAPEDLCKQLGVTCDVPQVSTSVEQYRGWTYPGDTERHWLKHWVYKDKLFITRDALECFKIEEAEEEEDAAAEIVLKRRRLLY